MVTITGANFPASTALVFRVDTTQITATSGLSSLSTGLVVSTIVIPADAAAGAHTITVAAGTSTATATFTVTALPALDPLSPASGLAGTDVTVSGVNFPLDTLAFKFDNTTVARKSGSTAASASGVFSTVITIPSGAAVGAHTITVTAGTTSLTATFTVNPPPAVLDALSPASGRAGSDVTISGTDFPASTTLVIRFDSTTVTPKSGDTATQSDGSFNTVITVPSSATLAAHTITVTAGNGSDNATFTVNAPATSVQISANGSNIGSLIVIVGDGFKAGGIATVSYDGVKVTEGNVNSSGSFVINFQAPVSTHGDHTIVATDGTNSENITYTVESTPPGVPIPLAPAMNASIKSPYLFDWADVTDTSAPVTYELQIGISIQDDRC
jgi:hypothetical protein